MQKSKPQPGVCLPIGLTIGAGSGLLIGLLTRNMAIWMALGAGIGLSLGVVLDQINQKNGDK
jgi:hypothetical protein